MFGSAILEVTIGLILLYTVLSMITTAAGELYNMVRRTRGDILRGWMDEVLGACEARELYLSGFIPGARITDGASGTSVPRCPAYMNDKDFAYGLMCFLACGKNTPDMSEVTVDKVCAGCQTRLHHDVEVCKIVPILAVRAGGDLKKLADEIAQWFNNSQDRVNGRFKREITVVTVITAFVLAFIANADTIKIADKLYNNTDTRQSALLLAQNLTRGPTDAAKQSAVTNTPANKKQDPTSAAKKSSVANKPTGSKKDPPGAAKKPSVAKTPPKAKPDPDDQSPLALLKSLERTDLLGWKGEADTYFGHFSENIPKFLLKLFGLILTTLALSLGAPYWFDVLNKLNQTIRTTGVKPDPSEPTT